MQAFSKLKQEIIDNAQIRASLGSRPLPNFLYDSMLFTRPLFSFIFWFSLVSVIIYVPMSQITQDYSNLVSSIERACFFYFLLFVVFPKKQTEAVYLRAFKQDETNKNLLSHLEVAVGEQYRLSGIMAPQRRIKIIWRPLIYIIQVLKYAESNFLNLEAGDDWKGRLWMTLLRCKLAFIDYRSLTPYVEEEIELCIRTLGVDRIIFIVDSIEEQTTLKKVLVSCYSVSEVDSQRISVVAWQDSKSLNTKFVHSICRLCRSIPASFPIPSFDSFQLVTKSIYSKQERRKEKLSTYVQLTLGSILETLLLGPLIWLSHSPEHFLSVFPSAPNLYLPLVEGGALILYAVVLFLAFRILRKNIQKSKLADSSNVKNVFSRNKTHITVITAMFLMYVVAYRLDSKSIDEGVAGAIDVLKMHVLSEAIKDHYESYAQIPINNDELFSTLIEDADNLKRYMQQDGQHIDVKSAVSILASNHLISENKLGYEVMLRNWVPLGLLKLVNYDTATFVDSWGTPIKYARVENEDTYMYKGDYAWINNYFFQISSAGPDLNFDTDDDIHHTFHAGTNQFFKISIEYEKVFQLKEALKRYLGNLPATPVQGEYNFSDLFNSNEEFDSFLSHPYLTLSGVQLDLRSETEEPTFWLDLEVLYDDGGIAISTEMFSVSDQVFAIYQIDTRKLVDLWESEYRIRTSIDTIEVFSLGPDKTSGTNDDIILTVETL